MRMPAIALVLSMIAAPLVADDAAREEAARIEYWIGKLGDDDPKVRQEASQHLRQIGKAALPALAEAARGKDPEVRNRANTLSQQIEQGAAEPEGPDILPPAEPDDALRRRPRPEIRRDFGPLLIPRAPGALQRFERSFSFARDGRTISIVEDNEGITVTTTQKRDGKTVTTVARARDKETLRKEHPEAYELYEQFAGRMDVGAGRMPGAMLLPPGGFERLDLEEFERDQIDRAFEDARKAMAEHRRLLDHQRDMMLEHRRLVEELRRQAMEEVERVRRDFEER